MNLILILQIILAIVLLEWFNIENFKIIHCVKRLEFSVNFSEFVKASHTSHIMKFVKFSVINLSVELQQ